MNFQATILKKQILAGNITKDADIELKLNSKNEFEFVNIQKSVEV